MPDAGLLLGYLLKVAFDGILGAQGNDALKHLCLKGIRRFSQNETVKLSITIR
jgi:hypothetical protein